MKTNHIHLNASRSVHSTEYRHETEFGILREIVPSPLEDRQEAAHYVHDHGLSTMELEDWL